MFYTLPGMGANNRMYGGAWRTLPECVFLNWPVHRGETSIASIARRIVDDAGIADGAVVIGSSLGGMVACEIARLRKLNALVLVGSATRKEEISRFLGAIHPLAGLAPLEFVQRAAGKCPGELTGMFNVSDAAFIRAACRAIFAWEGLDSAAIAPLRIHGRRDRVIPLPADAHCVIDGGHLIAMTHAEACVEFIRVQQARDWRS
ncbi:MAG: alpha/beta hydrolase [Phycisphaeraceae bacterium]